MSLNNGNQRPLSFKISELQTLYLSFTVVFICTGFFYNFIFLRLFGIRAELFFSLQDYLASSIEKVYLIFIAILIASGGSHVIRYLLKEQKAVLGHRLFLALLYLFPLLLVTAGLSIIVKFDNPTGYYLLSFAIYISSDYLLFRLVFKGSHESYSRFFILTVFLLYLLLIGSTIINDRDAVYKEPLKELKRYRIRFDRSVDLEANGNYFFFYDKQLRRSVVLRKEMVDYIENLR
jgi:hypothetical protein